MLQARDILPVLLLLASGLAQTKGVQGSSVTCYACNDGPCHLTYGDFLNDTFRATLCNDGEACFAASANGSLAVRRCQANCDAQCSSGQCTCCRHSYCNVGDGRAYGSSLALSAPATLYPYQFRCTSSGQVKWEFSVCDGRENCDDGSDEVRCPVSDGPFPRPARPSRGYPDNGCDFESDCVWTVSDEGGTEWTRRSGRTPTRETGPEGDHTFKNSSGAYLYMETSGLARNSWTVLKSPSYNYSTGSCLFTFYFHMMGLTSGLLGVSAVRDSDGQTLYSWSRVGRQPDEWIRGGLSIANISDPFHVEIKATHTLGGFTGDIAIDDLKFVNCNPNVSSDCGDDELTCLGTGMCIKPEQICDFRDDCLNGQDEIKEKCSLAPGYCPLDENLCGWQRISNDYSYFWLSQTGTTSSSLTGPESDHTSGNGRYLHIEASFPHVQGDVAGLRSLIFNPPFSQDCAFRFYYSMWGSDTGVLRLFLEEFNSTTSTYVKRKPLFFLFGQQGPDWTRASVNIHTDKPFVLIFEGERGGGLKGDIAIDDFSFGPGCSDKQNFQPSKQVLVKADCDFESDMCDWTNGGDNVWFWGRQNGETDSTDTGPDVDHTNGTSAGYYVYAEASASNGHSIGDLASLKSPLLHPSNVTSRLSFWYHMFGSGTGCLKVQVNCFAAKTDASPYVTRELWKKCRNQGSEWFQAVLSIDYCNTTDVLQVAMTAEYGTSIEGDISIDGIKFLPPLLPSPCSPSQFDCGNAECVPLTARCNFVQECTNNADESGCSMDCNFNNGWCNWRRIRVDSYTYLFRQQPTSNSAGFHAVARYFRKDIHSHTNLQSTVFSESGENCTFNFQYRMSGPAAGTLTVVIKTASSRFLPLLSLNGDQGSSWIRKSVLIGKHVDFQVTVQAVAGTNLLSDVVMGMDGGDIAVDDFSFENCAPGPNKACNLTAEFPCANGLCIPLDRYCDYEDDCQDGSDEKNCLNVQGRCNFESSSCDWSSFEWFNYQGKAPSEGTGPSYDHTFQTPVGHYIVSSNHRSGLPIRLQWDGSDKFPSVTDGRCIFRFWYHMWGQTMGNLEVVLTEFDKSGRSFGGTVIFRKSGNQGNHWLRAAIQIYSQNNYTLDFKATAGRSIGGVSSLSDIAIDDISPTPGCAELASTPPGSCGLGRSRCDNGVCIWNSWRCDGVNDCGDNSDELCAPFTPVCRPFERNCNVTGSGGPVCESVTRFCDGVPDCSSQYDEKDCPASCKGLFNCGNGNCILWKNVCDFQRDCTNGADEDEEKCKGQASYCDFEDGHCDWNNVDDGDNFDWWGDKTHFPGHYWFIEASEQNQDDVAKLRSALFEAPKGDCWIHYSAYIAPKAHGTLAVSILRQGEGKWSGLQLLQAQMNASSWSAFSVQIQSTLPYQLQFTAKLGHSSEGDMALDNVALSAGCSGKVVMNATSSNQTDASCTFEDGMCGRENAWNNSLHWSRHSGETSTRKSGPNHDHTLKTEKGQYVYVNINNRTGEGSLDSAVLTSAQDKSRLTFWYYMYGEDVACLRVYVICFHGERLPWQLCGNQQASWKLAQIRIPSLCQEYRVRFVASSNGGKFGDIAIDDISFDNGKTAEPSCGENRFQCDNGYCIHADDRCDFKVDCTDGSDETKCTSTKCTFEDGWCGWSPYSSIFPSSYVWNKAFMSSASGSILSTLPADLGDHTSGSLTGQVVFATPLDRSSKDGVAELRSTRFGQSGDHCTLRFYYFIPSAFNNFLHVSILGSRINSSEPYRIRPLWSPPSIEPNPGNWTEVAALIGHAHDFEVIFSIRLNGLIVDDISFENCSHDVHDEQEDCSGRFQCSNGQCIDPLQACDFHYDCGDHSDELDCPDVRGRCTFDDRTLCGWIDDSPTLTNLWQYPSSSSSLNTGPHVDVTNGTSSGVYIYSEASNVQRGTLYRLRSPVYPSNLDGSCYFSFWYHMYGATITNLTLYADPVSSGPREVLFQKIGQQGTAWKFSKPIYVNISGRFSFVFETYRGQSYTGDVALDGLAPSLGCEQGTAPACITGYRECSTSGHCLPARWWCDGVTDCAEGDDEADCHNTVTPCWAYQNPCGSASANVSCYWKDLWCDGTADCTDKSDEQNCPVSSSITGQSYPDGLCTFETDECGWIEAQDDDADWQRKQGPTPVDGTGPDVDNTLGTAKGYYLWMESRGLNPGDVAVWLSPVFDVIGWNCTLNFAYNMYGSGVGNLSVEVRSQQKGAGSSTIWSKSGNQGKSWQMASVDLSQENSWTPLRIAFVGKRGSTVESEIALDDIEYANCNPALKPPSCNRVTQFHCSGTQKCISRVRLCDFVDDCGDNSDELESECGKLLGRCNFETDLCGWTLQGEATSWLPQKSDPVRGRYLTISSLGSGQPPSTGRIESMVFSRTRRGGNCIIRFFSRIRGKADFALYVKDFNSSNIRTLFDSKISGKTDNIWGRTAVPFTSSIPYMFTVEGKTEGGEVDFDDISLGEFCGSPMSPPQPAEGVFQPNCNFETSCSDWSHFMHNVGVVWANRSLQQSGPICDNTFKTPRGNYLHLRLIVNSTVRESRKAVFVSPRIASSSANRFIKFSYYMAGQSVGCLTVQANCQRYAGVVQLWRKCGNQGLKWKSADVAMPGLGCGGLIEVQFVGEPEVDYDGGMALDNITFDALGVAVSECSPGEFQCDNRRCIDQRLTCNFVDDCGDQSEEQECSTNCTFESDRNLCSPQGLCHWTIGNGSNFQWNVVSLGNDHTTSSPSGHFVYVSPSPPPAAGVALLESVFFASSGSGCKLSFYYRRMDSSSLLSVRIKSAFHPVTSWSSVGGPFGKWVKASVSIGRQEMFRITFSAHFTNASALGIGIDDVTINNCQPDFDRPCSNGSEFACANSHCIKSNLVCDYGNDCGDKSDEQICPPILNSCSFENGNCGWTVNNTNPLSWRIGSGSSLSFDSPLNDHTTGLPKGNYAYLGSNTASQVGDLAMLDSPVYGSIAASRGCSLRFWYILFGDTGASFMVIQDSLDTSNSTTLFNTSTNSDHSWRRGSVPLNSESRFQLWLVAKRGFTGRGTIAVDDVSFSSECLGPLVPGGCASWQFKCGNSICLPKQWLCDDKDDCGDGSDEENCETESSGDFPFNNHSASCNFDFDSGFCGWHNDIRTDVAWILNSGITLTPGTGPSQDHTLANTSSSQYGHYVHTETSSALGGSLARLSSPILPPTGIFTHCRLVFFYHMYGSDVGSLSVLIKRNASSPEQVVWKKVGNQGDRWLRAEIPLSVEQDYQIVFENKQVKYIFDILWADVAIDGIQFVDCGPGPEPAPPPTPVPGLGISDCNFDTCHCCWGNSYGNYFDWNRARVDSIKDIPVDGSGNINGGVMVADRHTKKHFFDYAVLESRLMKEPQLAGECKFSLMVYSNVSITNGNPSVDNRLQMFKLQNYPTNALIKLSDIDSLPFGWSEHEFDLYVSQADSGGIFRVGIHTDYFFGKPSLTAIDDVKFSAGCNKYFLHNHVCFNNFDVCIPGPVFPQPPIISSAGDCDFTNGPCSLHVSGGWQAVPLNAIMGALSQYLPAKDASAAATGGVIYARSQSSRSFALMESPHILSAGSPSTGERRKRDTSRSNITECQINFQYASYTSGVALSLAVYTRMFDKIEKLWGISASSDSAVNWKKISLTAKPGHRNFRFDFVVEQEDPLQTGIGGHVLVDDVKFTGCEFTPNVTDSEYGKGAYKTGCTDGEREGLFNEARIAACGATWNGHTSMRLPETGIPCGDDMRNSSPCVSPADACDSRRGWHLCGSTGDVTEMSDVIKKDICYRSFYGRFSAGLDHCHSSFACNAPNKTLTYTCSQFKKDCDSPFCCGLDCTGHSGSCQGGVLKNATRFVPGLKYTEGCGHISATKAGGVLCCYDPLSTPPPLTPVHCSVCDFERGFCLWEEIGGDESAKWMNISASSAQQTIGFDHSLHNQNGHYLILSHAVSGVTPGRAILSSHFIDNRYENCSHCRLKFYYFINSDSFKPSSLEVYLHTDSKEISLWKSQQASKTWAEVILDLQSGNRRFRLLLIGKQGDKGGDIGLDDISFLPCEVTASVPTTLSASVSTTSSPSVPTTLSASVPTTSSASVPTISSPSATAQVPGTVAAAAAGLSGGAKAGISVAVIVVVVLLVLLLVFVVWKSSRSKSFSPRSNDQNMVNPVYGMTVPGSNQYDIPDFNDNKSAENIGVDSTIQVSPSHQDPYEVTADKSECGSEKAFVV